MRILIAVLILASVGGAQDAVRSKMEIVLERKEGKGWTRVEPTRVLASGDTLRFRFKSNFDGYLYVTNLGTSGSYNLLFPRQETGLKNVVKANQEYVVPSTDASFRVEGPAGYESVYWLVSPVALGNLPDLKPTPNKTMDRPTMKPRCDDTMFRSRGLCLDPAAGPRSIGQDEAVPREFNRVGVTSRELTVLQQDDRTVVAPAGGSVSAPVLYEFRIAHR